MHHLSRRRFLRLGASAALAAPFSRLLVPSAHAAVDTGSARRLLIYFTPNGTTHDHWQTAGAGAQFSFPAGSVLESLTPHQQDLLVLDGIDFENATNHEGGMEAMLTARGSMSIDQVVADEIGAGLRFPSLELSVQTSAWGGSNQTRMCYRDGAFVTPDDSPSSVFDRLFGGALDPSVLDRRLSVLDLLNDELGDLRGRLGSEEQRRMDQHLDSLRALESSLQGGGSCDEPASPTSGSAQSNDAFPDVTRDQIDLAVQALACEATNVVSLQLSHTVSPTVFTWLGESDTHHNLSHASSANPSAVQSFVSCERWYAEQFAYLLDRMKEMVDATTGAPLLDSTVVVWVKEMGDGQLHLCTDVPWVIAGSADGFFTSGRYLSLGGTSHSGVLTSICNALGLDIETFGAGTTGPVEALR